MIWVISDCVYLLILLLVVCLICLFRVCYFMVRWSGVLYGCLCCSGWLFVVFLSCFNSVVAVGVLLDELIAAGC